VGSNHTAAQRSFSNWLGGHTTSPWVRGELLSPREIRVKIFVFILLALIFNLYFPSLNSLIVFLFSVFGIFVTFYLAEKDGSNTVAFWLKISNKLARGYYYYYYFLILVFNLFLPTELTFN